MFHLFLASQSILTVVSNESQSSALASLWLSHSCNSVSNISKQLFARVQCPTLPPTVELQSLLQSRADTKDNLC